MSVKAMSWAFDLQLKPTLKLVLLALADRANDDGRCYPGQKAIADKCSMGERTVRRHLATLEERGLISRRPRFRDEGRGRTSDLITVHFQAADLAGGQNGNRPDDARLTGQEVPDQPATVGRARTISESPENPKSSPRFDEFWIEYPRKREKRDARKAWDAIIRQGIDESEIIVGLQRALPDWRKRSKDFVPYPASWLRAGGWEDEPDALTDEQLEQRLSEIWETA